MTESLLEQFLVQECNAHVQQLLTAAISDPSSGSPRLAFNRFEVTVDRRQGVVVIEDVLDASDAGVEQVPMAEFRGALARCRAQ